MSAWSSSSDAPSSNCYRPETRAFKFARKRLSAQELGAHPEQYRVEGSSTRQRKGYQIRKRLERTSDDYTIQTGLPCMMMALREDGTLLAYSTDRPVAEFVDDFYLPRMDRHFAGTGHNRLLEIESKIKKRRWSDVSVQPQRRLDKDGESSVTQGSSKDDLAESSNAVSLVQSDSNGKDVEETDGVTFRILKSAKLESFG